MLAVSGIVSFLWPFSLSNTRIHVVFALATLVSVFCHLAGRLRYFRSQFKWDTSDDPRPGRRIPKWGLAAVALSGGLLLAAAWLGWAGTDQLLSWSYESRHRAEIVRPNSGTGWWQKDNEILVARQPAADATSPRAKLNLQVRFQEPAKYSRGLAIWTESPTGSLIETLYLSPELAFSDQPQWGGQTLGREKILPIWRHRYTLKSGVEPDGTVDVFSGATASHQFSLEDELQLGDAGEFVLCVEINQAGDPNPTYTDPVLGQPSVLYTALVELDSERRYWVMDLTGHGGIDEAGGAIQYDLETLTTARSIIDLLLVHLERPER